MVDCAGLENRSDLNATPATNSTSEDLRNSLSLSLSVTLGNHPELASLIAAWPTLAADVRGLILGVARLTSRVSS